MTILTSNKIPSLTTTHIITGTATIVPPTPTTTTTIHALDRVLLWEHYVIPLYHSEIDRIAYWDFLEYPDNIPLYGIVIESWWANLEKEQQLKK